MKSNQEIERLDKNCSAKKDIKGKKYLGKVLIKRASEERLLWRKLESRRRESKRR